MSAFSLLLLGVAFALGCGDDGGNVGGPEGSSASSGTTAATGCDATMNAIVTDIDETLTTADSEWIMQIADGTHDPAARDGALELIQGYANRGYRILYLTARPEDVVLEGTGESAADATRRWLMEHGFPLTERTELQLAPSFVIGDTARDYKAEQLMARQSLGWVFDYAYGNADSDIGGYELAGIDKAATFIIGEEAGSEGTVAIEGEAWTTHLQTHLPTVDVVCEPDGA